MPGYFGVSIIRQTLTWTTGSLTCVCDFVVVACVYTRDTSVYCLIQRTFVESAQNLTREKSEVGRKAEHETVTHPFGDHARLCLTLAFENECFYSAPLLSSVLLYVHRDLKDHEGWGAQDGHLGFHTAPEL